MHLEILSGVFKDPRERRQRRTRGPPPNGRFATEGPSHFAMDLQLDEETPVPGGLSFDEVISLMEAVVAAGKRIVGMDLNEVAPDATLGDDELDASWDGNVAARLLYKMIGFALMSRGGPRMTLPKPRGMR